MNNDENKEKYFRFPIRMMQGILQSEDRTDFLTDVMYYAIASSLDSDDVTDDAFMEQASDKFSVNLNGGVDEKMNRGYELLKRYEKENVYTGISLKVFWDFYDNYKSEDEWHCLIMYLALRSIIGSRPYCKTTNDFLFARMLGKKNIAEYKKMVPIQWTRYKRDKVINDLRLGWNLKYYARGVHGFFFSFRTSLEEIILVAEKRKRNNKLELLKNKEKAILDEILKNGLEPKKNDGSNEKLPF